jgi:hypothetical protein
MTNPPIIIADPLLIDAEKSLYSALVPANPTKEDEIVGAIALSTYWRSKQTHAEKHLQEYGTPIDAPALRVQLSALKDTNECKRLISSSRRSLQEYLESTDNAELVHKIEKIVKENTKPWKALFVNLGSSIIYSVLVFIIFLCFIPRERTESAWRVWIGQEVITKPVSDSSK